MHSNSNFERFNKYLNSLPIEELQSKSAEESKRDEQDFQNLKKALQNGLCSFCGNSLTYFNESNVCFHWLLMPSGFKKKYFPLLYSKKSFHEIEAYLRWVANCDTPFQNINNLTEEKPPSKIIEETILYKNLEWSFSCSESDRRGHTHTYEGRMPHYHFQMKVDGNVVINYNGFHVPFHEYDDFCFAIKENKFDRLKSGHIHGAGMQDLLDNVSPEVLVETMVRAEDPEQAQLSVSSLVMADEGSTISGKEIAEISAESKRTGVSMAKLFSKLKNAKVTTIISPGPGVPKIAGRTKNRKRN